MKCVKIAKLFDNKPPKNRRFTPEEFVDELHLCRAFKRHPRTFFYDTPFYDWLPPEPKVNFKLNFTE